MFGFIRKKRAVDDAAFKVAYGLLIPQIILGYADDDHEFKNRVTDKYIRGYIFGLCDAIMQSAGVSGNDYGKIDALLTEVHIQLFGETNGRKSVGQSFRDQADPTFSEGRIRGGQELVEFLRDDKPPMGLARYLLNDETQ